MTTVAIRKVRGKAHATLDLIDACLEILTEIQPASVRAVCYQLFVRKLIPDMKKNTTNKVGRLLVGAREDGEIPWGWIVDETRRVEQAATWDNLESLIGAAVDQYRRDNWNDQPRRVEVWSEKGTIRGTIADVLSRYADGFRVMHGYGSATALHDAAVRSTEHDTPLHVIYVGDWDPSGLHMSEVDIPGRIDRYLGVIEFERVAILETDTDLPFFPAADKAGDSRYQWFVENHGHRCWELDALSPPMLRERVDGAIRNLIDVDAWNHSLVIEQAELESMSTVLDTFKSILRQAPKYPGGAA